MFIYFKETLEISKRCRKANGIWICQEEEGGLEGNSWGESHQSSSAVGPDGHWEAAAKCLRQRVVTSKSSMSLKKKNHILPNKLGHIHDGVSH